MKRLFLLSPSCFILSCVTLLGACSSSPSSRPLGHFEDTDAESMSGYENAQVAIAEHEPSMGVVMSLAMFTEHHLEDLAVTVLNSQIDTLWIVVPKDYSPSQGELDLALLYQKSSLARQRVALIKPQVKGKLREWARDWAPLTARTKDGKRRLLDFNYYSDRPADDSNPLSLAKATGLERVSVPVYNEGGNFMNNSQGDCLMTDRVVKANGEKELEGDQIYSQEQIVEFYSKFAGCKRTIIFESMPFEGTKHIDLWAKFLDDKTVIVNEIRDELLPLATYQSEALKKTKKVKDYLDARAQEIKNLGFDVVRVPMPLPWFGSDFNLFRSYTNSLIVNGTVAIPQYKKPTMAEDGINGQYVDQKYLEAYEKEVIKTHQDLNLKVSMIPSDQLIAKGGAIHCTTMQIAR